METLKAEGNHAEAEVVLDEDKVVCFAIPYDPGWQITVDGEDVEVVQGNIMYYAAAFIKGTHRIAFCHRKPYLITGTWISAAGFAVFCMYLWRKRDRTAKK